jgi:hypothetical protein
MCVATHPQVLAGMRHTSLIRRSNWERKMNVSHCDCFCSVSVYNRGAHGTAHALPLVVRSMSPFQVAAEPRIRSRRSKWECVDLHVQG